MANLLNPELIDFLACPDCHGDILSAETHLICCHCRRKYNIEKGIPVLYPMTIDIDHLKEEEKLASLMQQPPSSRKDRFQASQWNLSKQEFWEVVRKNIAPPPRSIVNLGCGYDSHFEHFEQEGYMFVNFDIVRTMLDKLNKDYGARSCVAGDINRAPFKKNVFDYVVSIDLIHHEIKNLFKLIESFRDLLKPGGLLFLEDPNAWGLFQMAKSIMLPQPLYKFLRSSFHGLRHSTHRPADYEFPTSVWRVKSILRDHGFSNITVYSHSAYPCIGEVGYRIFKELGRVQWVRKYHNYHYMLSAEKTPG
ncbi:MAG: methyltransferase domain-containing protein [Pseudomonadota bacterium]